MKAQKPSNFPETSVVEGNSCVKMLQNKQPSIQQDFEVSICASAPLTSSARPVSVLLPEVAVKSSSNTPSTISAAVPPQDYSNFWNFMKSTFKNLKNESVKREGLLQIQELMLELSAKDVRMQREMNVSNNTR